MLMKKRIWNSVRSMILMMLVLLIMYPQKVQASGNEFIKGMDLSSLEAVLDSGAVFYDENGNAIQDILSYLAEQKQVNYVRLRVWNNPTTSFDAGDYCNPAHTVEMAKKIKAAGMKLLIDFHYSDSWADPASQTKPAAWQNLSYSQLVSAVYEYTTEVLNDLKEAGAYPDMVQIGNEISGGMLWPDGYIDNSSQLAELLNSGIRAVRDTTPQGSYTKIMIHLAEGGDQDRFQYFFDGIMENGVTDFDVIGMSYYAYWHGSLQQLKNNMNNIVARYGKEVVVAETSYPFTYYDADSTENQIGQKDTDLAGLPASVANQRLMTEMTFNTVATVNNGKGLGVFYWEPLWLPVSGVGVTKGEGNEWDNQILFDANHRALDSINAFTFNASTAAANNNKHVIVYSPDNMIVQVDSCTNLTQVLPSTVDVLRYNGTIEKLPVTWNGASAIDTSVVGDYTFTGTVSNTNPLSGVTLATPVIQVSVQRNLIKNPGFEDCDNPYDWKINVISGDAGKITNGVDSYAYGGTGSFHYWDDNDFCVELTQSVDVIAGHTYDFSVWAQGTWDYIDYDQSYFFVRYTKEDGTETTLGTVELLNANYSWWNQFEIEGIQIPQGVTKVTVGGRVTGHANGYGTWDDFRLVDTDKNAVVPECNYVRNADFEDEEASDGSVYPSMNGWEIEVNGEWPERAWANDEQNHTDDGKYAFNYYDPAVFDLGLSQTVTGLPNGYYTFRMHSYGSNDAKNVMVYITSGGTVYSVKVQDTDRWSSSENRPIWEQVTLENIPVNDGEVLIWIDIDGVAGSWGYLDDASFVRQ